MRKVSNRRPSSAPGRRAFYLRLAAMALLLAHAGSTRAFAQTPAPSPVAAPTDERSLTLKSGDTSKGSQTGQAGPSEAKPELVLQTGYNNFFGATRLVFSPDGRLLATTTMNSTTVKLWEVATGRELRNLSGGGTSALNLSPLVAFSRDGRLLAAAAGDNTVKLWEVATGRELYALVGAQGSMLASTGVTFIAFSADGRTLVTISDAIRTWEVGTGRELSSLAVDSLNASAFSGGGGGAALTPDGSQLAIVDMEGVATEVKFRDLSTGREARALKLSDNFVNGAELTFTTDGRLLAAAITDDKRLKVWDVTAKGKERELGQTKQNQSLVRFSRDGRLLALAEGYTVRLWEVATGRELPALSVPSGGLFPDQGSVFVSFSDDGRRIATGGFDTQTLLWDVETGKQTLVMRGSSNMAYEVAFTPDGNFLFSGGRTRWDLRTGRGLRLAPGSSDKQLGFPSQDGRLLAAFAPNSNAVKLLDAPTGRELHTLAPQSTGVSVQHAVFSPDGKLIVTSYARIYTREGEQNEERPDEEEMKKASKEMMKASREALKSAQQDPAAMMKLYNDALGRARGDGGIEGQIKVWDVSTGRELRTLNAGGQTTQLIFSDDGRTLVTVGLRNEVTLWDVGSGAQLRSLTASPAPRPVASAPGGKQIPGMPDMSAIFSQMTDTFASMSAGTMGRNITSVAFSPDGRLVAAGGFESKSNFDPAAMMSAAMSQGKSKRPANPQDMLRDLKIETTGRVTLWDAGSGREVATLRGHGKGVTQVAFSRDGKLLASGGSDNTIKIWDVGSGRELRTLTGHTSKVNSIDFSPDARLIASAADDGSTFLWDAATGERLATLASLGDGSEWIVVTPDGLFDGSPASWSQILWRYNGDTFNVAPIEWFFSEFYYPGLLSEIFAGKRPRAAQDVSQKDRRQPQLKLALVGAEASPAAVTTREVKVRIEVSEAGADAANRQGSGARDMRLFRNGSLVKVWRGDVLKGQPSATLEASIPVVAGENRLVAYAFNHDNVKSKDARLSVSGADSLKRKGTAYVLAIGVNEYENAQYNLRYAVADAREFAAEVRRQQLNLSRYERVEIIPLLDRDATKANILSALRRLAGGLSAPTLKAGVGQTIEQLKPAEPEDAVIIYFAGHGTAQGQRFYLIPHDLGYTGERERLDEPGLRAMLSHSISDEELEQAVEELDAGHLLLVIDACNSGQALEAEEKRRGPMNSKGLAQLAYEKGMYVLTAAQSYQAALEAEKFGHGLLTYALVEEGLKTPAADAGPKDGELIVREWLDFATERVPQMQEEKMQQGGARGMTIAFTQGEQQIADPSKRTVQRPRVFYRRELESSPLIVARPAASGTKN